MTATREDILQRIRDEREFQIRQWGDQSANENILWSAIVLEELGEATKEVLHIDYEDHELGRAPYLKEELIQTAAVIVAWLEALWMKYP